MKRILLALWFALIFAAGVSAQNATPEAPLLTQPPAGEVAAAGVNLLFAFIGGLAMGGLGIGAILLLGITLILRSPVILTAVEGLIFSRLDKEGVQSLRGVGTVFSKAGELIDKITDGLPNEPAPTNVINVNVPDAPAPGVG